MEFFLVIGGIIAATSLLAKLLPEDYAGWVGLIGFLVMLVFLGLLIFGGDGGGSSGPFDNLRPSRR
jgi:TRAP-type C4-dicarboxylate transport system permease small subunit